MDLIPIPAQTAGPFFHLGCTQTHSVGSLLTEQTPGERISLVFSVFDGKGTVVPDAMIEIWQANAQGRYRHPEDLPVEEIRENDRKGQKADPSFQGFGRLATDEHGVCVFTTIRPGQAPGPNQRLQASHINVSIFARGILQRLATRLYFFGDPAVEHDPVLAMVPVARRHTLLAQPGPSGTHQWTFSIHLCGERETVFFDV